MIIYKVTNVLNGKIYIGQDTNNNPKYFGSGILIKKEIEKFGKSNFKKDILCECNSIEELNEKEKFWIEKLKSCNPEIGYNISHGGSKFFISEFHRKKVNQRISEKTKQAMLKIDMKEKIKKRKQLSPELELERRRKISLASIGKQISDVQKQKISKALKGHKFSEKSKNKISETLKQYYINNPDIKLKISKQFKGKKISEETIKKRRETQKKWSEEKRKQVLENRSKSLKGKIPWNKGLSKESDPRVAQYGATRKNKNKEKIC